MPNAPKPESAQGPRSAILDDLFQKFHDEADYYAAIPYEIRHRDKIAALDSLLSDGTLARDHEQKLVFPLTQYRLSRYWEADEDLLNKMLPVLVDMYAKQPEGQHSVGELAKQMTAAYPEIKLTPIDLQRAIILLRQIEAVAGWALAKDESGRTVITGFHIPSTILRLRSVGEGVRATSEAPIWPAPPSLVNPRPEPSPSPARISRWQVLRELGRGGQGSVSLVCDGELVQKALENIQLAVTDLVGIHTPQDRNAAAKRLAEAVTEYQATNQPGKLGALKRLHNKDVDAYKKALRRLESELRALSEMDHQGIVRLYDQNLAEGWFVMEFFPELTLGDHQAKFVGEPLLALTAFRHLVEAVALLHAKDVVHRDIKPDNIYVRQSGQLVVGDLGLVYYLDSESRATSTYENVGSRDWMPSWAYGRRQEQVTKNFDVFALGKVLWAMVSGKHMLPLWYFQNEEFNLRKLFPAEPAMEWINELLSQCVVENEKDCLPDAQVLLSKVNELIGRLRHGVSYLDISAPRQCRTCGKGRYIEDGDTPRNFGSHASTFKIFTCEHCGHVELFHLSSRGIPPPAWRR